MTRFRSFLILSKYNTAVQIRRQHHSFLRKREMIFPEDVTEIPHLKLIWNQYVSLKLEENNFKKFLLDELINEAQIREPGLHIYEKVLILQSSITNLKEENLIPNLESVVGGLLSSLEPFPFDYTFLQENEHSLTILRIRDRIEQHYLAWKYMVTLKDILQIYGRLKYSLFSYRSLGNLYRNLETLNTLPVKSALSVVEKIYYLMQRPLQTENLTTDIAGVNIQLLPDYCPRLLCHSHQYLLFLTSFLKELNFTEIQIQRGLPAFHLSFAAIVRRTDLILKDPETSKHRDEEKFFWLLFYKPHVLHDYINVQKATFVELTEMVNFPHFLKKEKGLLTNRTILHHVTQFFPVSSECGKTLRRHSKYKLVPETQILDTLVFLKDQNFNSDEIAESITIVLYPRESVKRILNKISLEAEALKKFGFKNGCVNKSSSYFKCGTKERRKLLQLCLYYLEKPHNFSGEGIWDRETENEADSLCRS